MLRPTEGNVQLRSTALADRALIHGWLVEPDVARWMFGLPLFPEAQAPTFAEFCADYAEYYFTGAQPRAGCCFIIEVGGEPVGQINHNEVFGDPVTTELDLWLTATARGQGTGPAALRLLIKHLRDELGVRRFLLRPSARNPAAIRAYRKAGFYLLDWPTNRIEATFGPSDYADCVLLLFDVA